jgi:hypothetical protein
VCHKHTIFFSSKSFSHYLYFDSDSCSCSSNRISCALIVLSRETILNREDTPPVIIPNAISFSYSLTGLMEKKTLEIPDKLKEENKQEFTRNDKYYASESGNKPTTTVGYPLPTGIHEFSIIREYQNTERHYTKTSRSIGGERNDQL